MTQAELLMRITQNRDQEQFQEMMVAGLDIVGELFMDIKRIAEKS